MSETARDEVTISIDETGDMQVQINGKPVDYVETEKEETPEGALLDVIMITKTNPTCVWRWGRRWCG